MLRDAFEALIGALYLDSDLIRTKGVVLNIYGDVKARLASLDDAHNPKSRLQEVCKTNNPPQYKVVRSVGMDHNREFEVEVYLENQRLGSGVGTSIKLAEAAAARDGLSFLIAEMERAIRR